MGIKNTSHLQLIKKPKGKILPLEVEPSTKIKQISRDFTFQEILDAESVYEGTYNGFAQDLEKYIRKHPDTQVKQYSIGTNPNMLTGPRMEYEGLMLVKEFIYNDTTYTFSFWVKPKDQNLLKKYPDIKHIGLQIVKKKKRTTYLLGAHYNQQSLMIGPDSIILPPPSEQDVRTSKEAVDLYCRLIGLFRDNQGLVVEDQNSDY